MAYNVLKYDVVDDEIEAVIIYYESISFGLGERFENEIENALTNLEGWISDRHFVFFKK